MEREAEQYYQSVIGLTNYYAWQRMWKSWQVNEYLKPIGQQTYLYLNLLFKAKSRQHKATQKHATTPNAKCFNKLS